MHRLTLYPRWIIANSLGEMAGLGLTFGLGYLSMAVFGEGAEALHRVAPAG